MALGLILIGRWHFHLHRTDWQRSVILVLEKD